MSEVHAKLVWDQAGTRYYHTGVKFGVLYLQNAQGAYPRGVAWNGLTSVNSSPDGAEPQDLYADNMKYASFRSAETYNGSISAYTFPDEWYACDGYATPDDLEGIYVGQQKRATFGFCYRTEVGSDTSTEDTEDYILHLVWGATASPSDQDHETINDSPDVMEFSWDFETTPVTMTTAFSKPRSTSYMELDSRKLSDNAMTAIETALYGSTTADARLPLPDEVVSIIRAAG